MMNDLYQDMIMEHGKNPRNFGDLSEYTHIAHGKNPLCGDHLVVMLRCEGNIVEDISFKGDGCAISKSSASLLTSALRGASVAKAKQVLEAYNKLLTSDTEVLFDLGKLQIFESVKKYPSRIKCAALSLRTIEQALEGEGSISTE